VNAAKSVEDLALGAVRWLASQVGVSTVELVLEAVLGTNPEVQIIEDVTVFAAAVVRAALDATDEARVRDAIQATRAAEDAVADKAEADMLAARKSSGGP
jgi:hypothetical protein